MASPIQRYNTRTELNKLAKIVKASFKPGLFGFMVIPQLIKNLYAALEKIDELTEKVFDLEGRNATLEKDNRDLKNISTKYDDEAEKLYHELQEVKKKAEANKKYIDSVIHEKPWIDYDKRKSYWDGYEQRVEENKKRWTIKGEKSNWQDHDGPYGSGPAFPGDY